MKDIYLRWAIYKNGHVTELEVTIDPVFIDSRSEYPEAHNLLNKLVREKGFTKSDYHILSEEYDGKYWISIEGSEKIF